MYLVICLCAFLFLGGCGEGTKKEVGDKLQKSSVVAVIGSDVLTLEEFNNEFQVIRKEYPKKLTPSLRLTLAKLKKEFLENTVEERLILYLARKTGIFLNSRELRQAVRNITGKSIDEMRVSVEKENLNFEDWLDKIKNRAIIEKLIQEKVYSNISVDMKEVEEYFKHNPSEFIQEEGIRLLQIVLETEVAAIDVMHKLKKGEKFQNLVKKVSLYKDGGSEKDHGYIIRGQLPKELEEIAFSLKKGKVSNIVETAYGFHILKCVGKTKRHQMKFKEALPIVKRILENKKKERFYSEWIGKERKKIKITINPALLKVN